MISPTNPLTDVSPTNVHLFLENPPLVFLSSNLEYSRTEISYKDVFPHKTVNLKQLCLGTSNLGEKTFVRRLLGLERLFIAEISSVKTFTRSGRTSWNTFETLRWGLFFEINCGFLFQGHVKNIPFTSVLNSLITTLII